MKRIGPCKEIVYILQHWVKGIVIRKKTNKQEWMDCTSCNTADTLPHHTSWDDKKGTAFTNIYAQH